MAAHLNIRGRSTPCVSRARPGAAHRRPAVLPHASGAASEGLDRRSWLVTSTLGLCSAAGAAWLVRPDTAHAADASFVPMDPLKDKDYGKPRMKYKDYIQTDSGLQYQDLKEGTGDSPKEGDTCVIDWDGYTIGYYGRVFEARNKPKGSSFTGDNKDFYRFVLGSHTVIPGLEEAVASMKVGGIRRVVVPVEVGYPDDNWRKLGPKPTTFAGDRTLDFVLSNRGLIDKTLLFNIELKNVIRQ